MNYFNSPETSTTIVATDIPRHPAIARMSVCSLLFSPCRLLTPLTAWIGSGLLGVLSPKLILGMYLAFVVIDTIHHSFL